MNRLGAPQWSQLSMRRPADVWLLAFQARPARWWPTFWTTSSARTSSAWRRSARIAASATTGAFACAASTQRPPGEGAGPSVSPRRSRESCLRVACESTAEIQTEIQLVMLANSCTRLLFEGCTQANFIIHIQTASFEVGWISPMGRKWLMIRSRGW